MRLPVNQCEDAEDTIGEELRNNLGQWRGRGMRTLPTRTLSRWRPLGVQGKWRDLALRPAWVFGLGRQNVEGWESYELGFSIP